MPRGIYLSENPRGEGVTDRERAGFDILPRRRFQPLPATISAAGRRTIEAATRARREAAVPTETVVPGGTPPPESDPMTFIPIGGSGPTSPTFGGYGPTGGGYAPTGTGGSIGDAIREGVGGLINRGIGELGDRIFGGSGSEAPGSGSVVPGSTSFTGPFDPVSPGTCPGVGSIRVAGKCVNLGDLGPGGAPAVTPQVGGDWNPVAGLYGVGVTPMVEERIHRSCPPGFVLGKDGVCYDGLSKSKRKWNPGRKPLLTGGEMAAIAKAKRAAGRLNRTKKSIKKAARALEKSC